MKSWISAQFSRIATYSAIGGLAAASVFACSSSSSGSGSGSSGGPTDAGKTDAPVSGGDAGGATLTLKVTYNGMQQGALLGAVFTQAPASASVMPTAENFEMTQAWPGTTSLPLTGLTPGTYYVIAFISVGAISMSGPLPGDPVVGFPPPNFLMTTVAAGGSTLDITLTDPVEEGGTGEGGTGPTEGGTGPTEGGTGPTDAGPG